MKNVTITIDDETHRNARIRAAELGTSLSALVKTYLQQLAGDPAPQTTRVREMPMTFNAAPAPPAHDALPPGSHGRFDDGTPYYTKDGKPRQPGAMRGMTGWTEDFDAWPDGFLDAMHGDETPASRTWLEGPVNDALLTRQKD
jgi:hypothetical protein